MPDSPLVPVRVRNDPGALHGARHRPRTSDGLTNKAGHRSFSRSSTGSKLPPLNEGRPRSQQEARRRTPTAASSSPQQQQRRNQKKPKKHHPYAKKEAKPLEVKKTFEGMQKDPADTGTLVARNKRCVRHFDKMRQFAYVRNSKLTDLFMKYNTNGDDVIDIEEFMLMLNRMSMDKFLSEREMREMFAYADPDGSGGIDLTEFKNLFGAQEPLARKTKKMNALEKTTEEFRQVAAQYATDKEREVAIKRASELQSMVATKLLQKKSASYGNNVRQDGRMFFMAFKTLDRDGDGIVTYDEFKETFGPRGFDLGLADKDMRDLILSIDQEKTGLIECNLFLQRIRESDKNSDTDPFQEHFKEQVKRNKAKRDGLEAIIQGGPDEVKTTVDNLHPVGQVEDKNLRPEVTEGMNPFSAAERSAKESGSAKKWEAPSPEEKKRMEQADKQRAHTARLMRKLNSTPHWDALSKTSAKSFKTVQQQRISVASQRKGREMGGSFRLTYALRDPNAPVYTHKSREYTPKPQDTFNTVGYGRDDTSLFAKPDEFNEKAIKYARRQARARINHEHQKRIWKYRRDKDVQAVLQDAARLKHKVIQREKYLAAAAEEGDRLYKKFNGGGKALYHSEISQRQRFGDRRHFGDKAADHAERYSGGVNIPL